MSHTFMKIKHPKTLEELKGCIESETNVLYASAQTSTVIPWSRLEELAPSLFENGKIPTIVSLQSLPKKMEMNPNHQIYIEGPISWREADQFARSHGRRMMTMPTEDLASVLAGLATSCTGEHAFGLGTTRDQVSELTFLNKQGEKCYLDASKPIETALPKNVGLGPLKAYQNLYRKKYKNFKNAPFQRLEKETDLLVGSEGKVGPIIAAKLETIPNEAVVHLFFPLKTPWTQDFKNHFKYFQWGQQFRGQILAFELIDQLSLKTLETNGPENFGLNSGWDYLFFEILETSLDVVLQGLMDFIKVEDIDLKEDEIYVMDSQKFHLLRKTLPRVVAEMVSSRKIVKKGTDVQVASELFAKLIERYQHFYQSGVSGILFGHFGDAHLHFNFFPKNVAEQLIVDNLLENFYKELPSWGAVSPFAEHGVGLIKKKYLEYYQEEFELFKKLKFCN